MGGGVPILGRIVGGLNWKEQAVIKWVTGIGAALVVTGLIGYFATGMVSWTALIPAIPGVLFIILGLIGQRGPGARKHAMHVAAVLALLGTAGGLGMGVPQLIQWMGGTEPARPAAVILQAVMGVLCLVLLVAAIRSFAAARRARTGGGPAGD